MHLSNVGWIEWYENTYESMNQVLNQEYLYGILLSENIIGVIHDHFIIYYLDVDVDGSDNLFAKVNIKKQ